MVLAVFLVSSFTPLTLSRTQADGGQQKVSPVELSTLSPKLVLPDDSSKPIRVPGGLVAAQIITKGHPIFSLKAKCSQGSKTLAMHAIIGKDGHVKSVEAISGADVLRQPTADAVRQWVYRPFQLYGQPVEVETTITFMFNFNAAGCDSPHN